MTLPGVSCVMLMFPIHLNPVMLPSESPNQIQAIPMIWNGISTRKMFELPKTYAIPRFAIATSKDRILIISLTSDKITACTLCHYIMLARRGLQEEVLR
jgi:hypothetical protein